MPTDGEYLLQRIIDNPGRCLGCGLPGLMADETGFPPHFCANCRHRRARELAKTAPPKATAASERKLKQQALDNLDRLMTGEPIVPESPDA